MSDSKMSKTEVLLIAVTACALEGKAFNNTRLAQVSNCLTGKADTPNAIELRMREYKKKARDLLAMIDSGEIAVPVSATPKSRGKAGVKTPKSDGMYFVLHLGFWERVCS
jgi:hypothetical protein